MLVIPVRDENTPGGLAIVTIVLVLINALVFFALQMKDEEAFAKAADFYMDSRLVELEISRYPAFLREKGDAVAASHIDALLREGDESQANVFYRALSDGQWQDALASGRIITAASPSYQDWHQDRQQFEVLLQESMSWSWGTIPARLKPATLSTSMFLHGSFEHLLGNMIFLVLVGFLVEPLLGSLRFLIFYLLSGVASDGLYILANPDLYQPCVGASGAIAGVMGMYAILYGLRNIRVFYWVVVYFGYRNVPALLLFPFWVFKEVFEKLTSPGSNVAYEAHIGGLLAGAALASLYRWRHNHHIEEKHVAVKEKKARAVWLQQAREKTRALDFNGALQLYSKLLAPDYKDIALCLEAWRCARYVPGELRDRVARHILSATPSDTLPLSAQLLCFMEYSKDGGLPLPPAVALRLALRFLKADEAAGAERLLLQLRAHADLPGSDMAWGQLIMVWRRGGKSERAQACEKYLRSRYPESTALQRLQAG